MRTIPAGRCLLRGVALNRRRNSASSEAAGPPLAEAVAESGPDTSAGSITCTPAAAEVASTPAIIRLLRVLVVMVSSSELGSTLTTHLWAMRLQRSVVRFLL